VKLTSEQNEKVVELIEQAHAEHATPDGFETRKVGERFIDLLADLQRFGHEWPAELIRQYAVTGGMTRCRDWRDAHAIEAKTPKSGASVRLPSHGVAKRRQEDGKVRHLRLPLRDLSRDELREYISTFAAQRDTLSREIAVLAAALGYMDANPACTTTGAAFDALGLAA
jgi:hypothetical protein